VIVREVLHGRAWSTRPMRVVRDEPDLLALHMACGTTYMCPVGPAGDYDRAADPTEVRWEQRAWERTDALVLARPGEPWATRVYWDAASGEHLFWYVNVEEPMRRTALGFDTMDDELDIVVHPDRSVEWKDEELLAHWVDRGVYSAADAARIRANGERALREVVEPWASPLCDGWEHWRAPSGWQLPSIPEGWDVVEP
jgi:hypothetical protein